MLQIILFLYLSTLHASFGLAPIEASQQISYATIDPINQKKEIHFYKNFESIRSDGQSDVDFFKSSLTKLQLSHGETLHLYLRSSGGEISVGLNIHSFLLWLKEKGIRVVTHVNDHCDSICIPVFAAGTERLAASTATFIFHPPYYPHITNADEKISAVNIAAMHYLQAISVADPLFAKIISENKWIKSQTKELLAKEIDQLAPAFLIVNESVSLSNNCGYKNVTVRYNHIMDYTIACDAIQTIKKFVKSELQYNADASIMIEFKDTVLFNTYDTNGTILSSDKVYGLYNRVENKIELSSFRSDIVQNRDREHFSVKINSLPFNEKKKDLLLKQMHLSVVIHELTHLFTQHNFVDTNPSHAVHEYFSYVIQIKSMDKELRELILNANANIEFTNDMQINSMIHYGNPHQFGVMSYKHFERLGSNKEQFIKDALNGNFRPDDLLEML